MCWALLLETYMLLQVRGMPPRCPLWDQGPHPHVPQCRGLQAHSAVSPQEFPLRGRVALFNIRASLGATASNEKLMWGCLSPSFKGLSHPWHSPPPSARPSFPYSLSVLRTLPSKSLPQRN